MNISPSKVGKHITNKQAIYYFYIVMMCSIGMYQFTSMMAEYQLKKHNINGGTARSYLQYSFGWEKFKGSFFNLEPGWYEWKARLGSSWLAGLFQGNNQNTESIDPQKFMRGVGVWWGGWFFAVCIVYYLICSKTALLMSLLTWVAIIAAVVFPMSGRHLTAWDMPAMFGFALLFYFVGKRWAIPSLLMIILWTPMKETIAAGAFAFLFWKFKENRSGDWLRRIGFFILGFGLSNAIRMWAWKFVGGAGYHRSNCFIDNINIMLLSHNQCGLFDNPWLAANLGLIAVYLLFCWRGIDVWMWKVVCISLLGAIALFGRVNEYRVFFELIPICFYFISNEIYEVGPIPMSAKTGNVVRRGVR